MAPRARALGEHHGAPQTRDAQLSPSVLRVVALSEQRGAGGAGAARARLVPEQAVDDEGEDLVGVAHHVEGPARHVQLVPGEGRGASSQYRVRDAARPVRLRGRGTQRRGNSGGGVEVAESKVVQQKGQSRGREG